MSVDVADTRAVPRVTTTRARRQRRTAPLTLLLGIVPIALPLGLWQLLGSESGQYPRTSAWFDQLSHVAESGALGTASWATVKSFLLALVISTFLGSVVGTLVGRSVLADRAFGPLFEFARVLPIATLVPVAAVLGGYTDATKISIAVVAGIWPVLLQVRSATRAIHGVLSDTIEVLHLSRWARLRKVFLPLLLPDVVAGVRIGAPMLIIVVVLVEMITGLPGLGAQLMDAQQNYNAALVFGLVLCIGGLALAVNVTVALAEALVLRRWPGSRQ